MSAEPRRIPPQAYFAVSAVFHYLGPSLAGLLSRPGVTAPVIWATRLGHISDALAAADLTLTAGEMARLEEPYVPHPVLAHE